MSWVCPKCQKQYDKQNQHHDCASVSIEELLRENEVLIALFKDLVEEAEKFGPLVVRISTKAVTLPARVGFALVYPKKDSLDVGIFLPDKFEEFPVYKAKAYTKTKFVNWIRLYDAEDLSASVLQLLQAAYAHCG